LRYRRELRPPREALVEHGERGVVGIAQRRALVAERKLLGGCGLLDLEHTLLALWRLVLERMAGMVLLGMPA
jgi:hypothetical protein